MEQLKHTGKEDFPVNGLMLFVPIMRQFQQLIRNGNLSESDPLSPSPSIKNQVLCRKGSDEIIINEV